MNVWFTKRSSSNLMNIALLQQNFTSFEYKSSIPDFGLARIKKADCYKCAWQSYRTIGPYSKALRHGKGILGSDHQSHNSYRGHQPGDRNLRSGMDGGKYSPKVPWIIMNIEFFMQYNSLRRSRPDWALWLWVFSSWELISAWWSGNNDYRTLFF